MLKLNLGCGGNKRDGYVNVDRWQGCSPDKTIDLEATPWMEEAKLGERMQRHHWVTAFDESTVDEVLLIHVLEHIGQSPATFLRFMKELYRVCCDGATVFIAVPHPRHDDFLGDPTHVRPVTPAMLSLFSKKNCDAWREQGAANSRLAHQLGVDFEIIGVEEIMSPSEETSARYGNWAVKEIRIMLKVNK